MFSRLTCAVLAAGLCLAAPAADAAMHLEPGLWQQTETGTEDGKPVAPQVIHDCLTADNARDPVKALTQLKNTAGQHCKTMQVQENGDQLSFEMECGDPQRAFISLSMHVTFFGARHYGGTIKSIISVAGHTVSGDKHLDSIWLGPNCKAH